jgi:hypothetical protein
VMSAQLAESDDAAISLLRLAGRTNIAQALRHNARNPNRPLQTPRPGVKRSYPYLA